MCSPHLSDSYFYQCRGYVPKERKRIRWQKLNKFAVERWADANTVGAAKFWKAVMDKCVETRTEWVLPVRVRK